jgi:tRNA (guanine37-N1)-methyltransferase
MLKFDIITIFPKQVENFLNEGIYRIAKTKGIVDVNVHDLRKWSDDKHRSVDDKPYGGGAGMIIMVEPIDKAIKELKKENTKVIITTPRGQRLTQKVLKSFSKSETEHYIILCGHYEGFDERIHEFLADYEVSIGDFVLSQGELPALVLIDGIIRLLPGVLGNSDSLLEESFEDGLEYPQYTRPEEYNGMKVPEVLLSGHHKKIQEWKKEKSIGLTTKKNTKIVN